MVCQSTFNRQPLRQPLAATSPSKEGEAYCGCVVALLESDSNCAADEDKLEYEDDSEKWRYKLKPLACRRAHKTGDEEDAVWPEHIGEAVTKLEGKNCCLAGNTYHIGERRHNRHNCRCLTGA